ncbi:Z1 domain-containing protein [Corynebacterium coyleae]|uniref:Z1 domain-containing protein n=1 Tax=Corynebacterium coyleae TaxID=53374 RepID=UPI00254F9DBA|nr:Z1 domain-containing protein [Corynebacterium coyleae]MDK8663200.1 Z1 domain-containing protein [Corynebacterium coyleae]MDK8706454.1 Z1 domain-containing protein [Corynebacterium coyleae]MDK8733155.1 Z1 domain-containing protein [Corynebacterium coyleae]MDK8892496.1 Z1 domain-containing protein [Corynebacterium coyleae]
MNLSEEERLYKFIRNSGFASSFRKALEECRQLGMIDDQTADALLRRHKRSKDSVGRGGPIITRGQEGWYEGADRSDPSFGFFADVMEQEGKHLELEIANEASDLIVNMTPDPESDEPYAAKGLVVGFVQSGKTTNFTAVAAKLADYNYRMVIVLAGIHNALRAQTQTRLEKYLIPRTGRWVSVTGKDHDFDLVDLNKSSSDSNKRLTASYFLSNKGKTSLLVVKKNATVLRKLRKWLGQPESLKLLKQNHVLVIDDEADQASVETATINPLIRDILGMLPKSTYIGYTATPFANVFIDPTVSDDLYPRDFIYPMPRPEGYFGPEMIFGREVVNGDGDSSIDGYDMVRIIPEEDEFLYRPKTKDEVDSFVPKITDELRRALHWFLLATAARWHREGPINSSMLIHTSFNTVVHESYRVPLQKELDFLRDSVHAGVVEVIADLNTLWNEEVQRVDFPQGAPSEQFETLMAFLPEVLDDCRIIIDNSRSLDRLSYEGKSHNTVIAIGGNTLSRGITLDGLVCSFFIRPSNTYDTLLQMGRWFGFRQGYEDLPRIWMTETLRRNFRHLALVEYEMRLDMEVYEKQNLTPLDFAVAVRTHPALMITRKMGAAQPSRTSYSGARVQVRMYERKDLAVIENNWLAGETLIQQAERRARPVSLGNGSVLYRDVPVDSVIRFLETYEVHPEQTDVDTSMICEYIREGVDGPRSQMALWNVAIKSGDGSPGEFAGHSLNFVNRAPIGEMGSDLGDLADIGTLMVPQDLIIDIDGINPNKVRQKGEHSMKKLRFDTPQVKDKGLLVLYPIDKASRPMGRKTRANMDAQHDILGIGIVFPDGKDWANPKQGVVSTHVRVQLPAHAETVETSELMNDE